MEYTKEQLKAMKIENLDEIVHDLKGHEASLINNSGKEEQIAYILGENGNDELS